MNQDQTTPPNGNMSQIPSWFSDGQPEPSKEPGSTKHHRRPLLTIVAATVVFFAAIVIILLIALNNNTNCLTTEDYRKLASDDWYGESFDPKSDFYGFSATFQQDTDSYETEPLQEYQETISKLVEFYNDNKEKPMLFTISASYETVEDLLQSKETLIKKRVEKVKSELVSKGIPNDMIRTAIETYSMGPEDARPDNSDSVSISLTSAATCQ